MIESPHQGLSPLARGNLGRSGWLLVLAGPIPARAGQPKHRHVNAPITGAYPRSRGATNHETLRGCRFKGLSPLARGNHVRLGTYCPSLGPIPARAGQPPIIRMGRSPMRAYPRSRGATSGRSKLTARLKGLSPLARGNLELLLRRRAAPGPIPARAGQPRWPRQGSRLQGAYPRSRGATYGTAPALGMITGLSPLARGNLLRHAVERLQVGPIPARAGQPAASASLRTGWWAYPRSRGATELDALDKTIMRGLSPLARGNRGRHHPGGARGGPIPARAGQPASRAPSARRPWAYPRSRGATCVSSRRTVTVGGLSPLARGNRRNRIFRRGGGGPIPARAGQPLAPNSLSGKRKLTIESSS